MFTLKKNKKKLFLNSVFYKCQSPKWATVNKMKKSRTFFFCSLSGLSHVHLYTRQFSKSMAWLSLTCLWFNFFHSVGARGGGGANQDEEEVFPLYSGFYQGSHTSLWVEAAHWMRHDDTVARLWTKTIWHTGPRVCRSALSPIGLLVCGYISWANVTVLKRFSCLNQQETPKHSNWSNELMTTQTLQWHILTYFTTSNWAKSYFMDRN